MSFDPTEEDVEVILTLTAADDLADALGAEDIHAETLRVILWVPLHVEGLHLLRIAMNHQGLVIALRENGLIRRAEVRAIDEVAVRVLPQDRRGLLIGEPRERALDRLELREISL